MGRTPAFVLNRLIQGQFKEMKQLGGEDSVDKSVDNCSPMGAHSVLITEEIK